MVKFGDLQKFLENAENMRSRVVAVWNYGVSPTSYDVITNVIYGPQWKHPSTYLPCFIVIAKRTSEEKKKGKIQNKTTTNKQKSQDKSKHVKTYRQEIQR